MFSGLKFELLGPVGGWRDGTEVDLGSPQQRTVLAMLLLARGRQVPLDSLIDGLWGQSAPKSAVGTMRTYISRLRHRLETGPEGGAETLIKYVGDGYSIQLRSAVLDVDVFERCLNDARAARRDGQLTRARQLLRTGLGLWHGAALAGAPGPYADSRRVHLTELYVAALEEKLAADIMAGDHAVAIADLRAVLTEYPFREGLSELLMLALYKSGRQAEALGVFDTLRWTLRDELGVDPGPALRNMHQRILRADEDLVDLADSHACRLPLTRITRLLAAEPVVA
jgi:DNA-binding SARP family transcriptional activator